MTKSNYLQNYAESFAIFAKYQEADILDLDYNSIGVHLAEEVTPEDAVKLQELGWRKSPYGYFYKEGKAGI
jgi:hypothetical protein